MAFRRAGLVFLCLLFSIAPSGAGELEQSRRELAEIERRIELTSSELSGKQSEAGSLHAELRKVEGQRAAIEERIAALQARKATLNRQEEQRERAARQASEAVEEREVLVRKRLAALYKSGDMGFLRVLFAPEAPARRAEKYDYLGRIVRRDRELVSAYREEVAAHELALRRLRELRDEQQELLDKLGAERQTLARAEKIKKQLLARLRRDEEALSVRLAELRRDEERLEELIKKLESAKSGEYTQRAGAFADRRGKLPWPAAGSLVNGFGRHRHPDLGTLVDSRGFEIAVDGEAPFNAVWPGRVIFAKSFPGYGNLLIVDHGDGYYTLYAKGARLTKGVDDQVAAGETVAFAGRGEDQSLYFEIRHRGNPLDPGDWLAPR